MKLLVRNLARTTTEAEISVLFTAQGEVTECTLVLDSKTGESKGFAFIEMPNDVEAEAAITSLHHANIANNKIRVKAAD
ncbi:MAG: RNA recognition motif-containing protein [Alphaproteobacteria bacterium]|jgi:RNA recognition motif-containing protein